MSVNKTWAGVTYALPQNREPKSSWGVDLSNFIIAVADQAIPKTGGLNTLAADLNFGATYGILAPYIKSASANIAAAGVVRLANTDTINWRNNANGADVALGVNTSDRLTVGGVVVPTVASTDTLTNKTLSGAVTAAGGAVVGTSDSQTLTSKTLTSPVLATPAITGAIDLTNTTAPATPSAGHTALYPSSVDGKMHVINSAGTDSVLGASGSGELNLVSNPSDAVSWTAATGATLATTTTAGDLPLSSMVATAIKITSGTGTSTEATLAQTNSYSFTTPASYAVKTKVEFWLRPGTNFIASEWTVSVYAGSTRQALITTDASSVTYIPNANGKFTTYFDAAASTAYTVRFTRVNNAGANAGVLNVTNVIVGPGIQPQGAVIGNWISYTPTVTGLGAGSSSVSFFYRQVGGNWEVRGRLSKDATPGSGTTAVAITLPGAPDSTLLTTSNTLGYANLTTSPFGSEGDAFWGGGLLAQVRNPGTTNNVRGVDMTANSEINYYLTYPGNGLSGTVNLAQNDVQHYYGTGGTWGTTATLTTAQGKGGVLGGTTTPGSAFFDWTIVPATPIPIDAVAQLVVSSDGVHWGPTGSPVGSINFENLRYDNTNFIGGSASITSSGNILVRFGKYPYGVASTPYTGTWYWKVVVGLPGQAVGFGIVNPGTSSGLVAAAGLPGNTTGNAIAAGYVGEVVEATQATAASGIGTSVYFDAVSVTLTPGIWMINYLLCNTASGATELQLAGGISTTAGNSQAGLQEGDNWAFTLGAISTYNTHVSIPCYVVRPTTTTTYYGKAAIYFSSGSPQYSARITAVRIA